MTFYVSAEQMDVIDLIRGVITRTCANDNQKAKDSAGDHLLCNYFEGKVTAWNSILYYLDKFEILEDEE